MPNDLLQQLPHVMMQLVLHDQVWPTAWHSLAHLQPCSNLQQETIIQRALESLLQIRDKHAMPDEPIAYHQMYNPLHMLHDYVLSLLDKEAYLDSYLQQLQQEPWYAQEQDATALEEDAETAHENWQELAAQVSLLATFK